MEDEDSRKILLLTNAQRRLKRGDWQSKATPAMETLGLLHASTHPTMSQANPPRNPPPPILTYQTPIAKCEPPEIQKEAALKMINDLDPVDLLLFTDGSIMRVPRAKATDWYSCEKMTIHTGRGNQRYARAARPERRNSQCSRPLFGSWKKTLGRPPSCSVIASVRRGAEEYRLYRC